MLINHYPLYLPGVEVAEALDGPTATLRQVVDDMGDAPMGHVLALVEVLHHLVGLAARCRGSQS